jgi:hypothetical protein
MNSIGTELYSVLPYIHTTIQSFASDGRKLIIDIWRFWEFGPYRVFFARPSIIVTDPNLMQQLLLDRTKSSKIIKERRLYHIADALVGKSERVSCHCRTDPISGNIRERS